MPELLVCYYHSLPQLDWANREEDDGALVQTQVRRRREPGAYCARARRRRVAYGMSALFAFVESAHTYGNSTHETDTRRRADTCYATHSYYFIVYLA